MEFDGFAFLSQTQVEHLDGDGEGHGEVDVTLGDMAVGAVDHQHDADEDQEAEGEHLDRRVAVDEVGDRLGGEEHDDHRDHYRE